MTRTFSPDDPERREWQNPEEILGSVGLVPGMVFVDPGCGDGFFSLPAARIVGPEGKVFAVDIDAGAVGRLRKRASDEGLAWLVAEAASAEETIACEGCADIVFFGIDLHDFADPAKVIRNAKIMLRPSGKLVDLDWTDRPTPFGPPPSIRFSIAKARQMIEGAGFAVRSSADAGPYHYLIIATP
jgi:ubiquinone/menaquinone biosynthesis C-methylase UbiE